MTIDDQIMPDHPLYLQARDAHRVYLESKERSDPAATVDRLRLIYEAQMKPRPTTIFMAVRKPCAYNDSPSCSWMKPHPVAASTK